MKKFLTIACFIFATFASIGKTNITNAGKNTSSNTYSLHTPLCFIENKGQITDQNNNPRPDIQYKVAAAPGLNVFIGNGAIHYQFSKAENSILPAQDPNSKPHISNSTINMYRMDVELVGANKYAPVIAEKKQAYYENHFTAAIAGGNGAKAYTYGKIIYKNVYPHIDWAIYTLNGQLKQEFVINKGGKVADIQLRYGGATSINLGNNGSFTTATPMGVITEHAPYSYQADGKAVASKFRLTGDVLGFETGSYSGTLVIDPTLVWATYFGSYDVDYAFSVATSTSGSVYICGETNSASGIVTTGTYIGTYMGLGDAILAKFDGAGSLRWATYYGGTGEDALYSVATDSAGNVYASGQTKSTSGIATPGAYQTSLSGAYDAFLVKFDSSGSRQWGTYYGGSANEYNYSVAVDISANVYIAGMTVGSTGLATPGAYQATTAGASDGYLAKFSSSGAIVWATYFGGPGNDNITGVATDRSGNVFISGSTASTSGIATPGSYQATYGGGTNDVFLAKFNPSGSIQWASYFGGASDDQAYAIACDDSGSVYITGSTASTSGIATPGAYQVTNGGGARDTYIGKFSGAGAIQWASYFGGAATDFGVSVVTMGRNVFVAGTTNSTSAIATPGAYQAIYGGGIQDAFLAEFSSTGAIEWATYYGGLDEDDAESVTTDNAGNIFITGITASTSGISTPGAHQVFFGGATDAFLAKFNFCDIPDAGVISGPSALCVGVPITLTDTVFGGTWSASNGHAVVAGGLVTGITSGVDTISYTVSSACVTAVSTHIVTVDVHGSGTILGPSNICAGDSVTLTDAITAGVWSASNGNATVAGGIVHGITLGADTISYTVTNSCGTFTSTHMVTVNPFPVSGTISGPSSVCIATPITLTDPATGGTWSTGNADATVAGGVVTGVTAGVDTIKYSVSTACRTSVSIHMVTVNPLPDSGHIHGLSEVCVGSTITLADTAAGGIWSSKATALATVAGGVVTGAAVGLDTILYAVTNVCGTAVATYAITVDAIAPVGPITGKSTLCVDQLTLLSDTISGGVWSISNANLLLDVVGNIAALYPGLDTVTYTVVNNCGSGSVSFVVTILSKEDCIAGTQGPLSGQSGIDLYPNPAHDQLTIKAADKIYKVDISDLLGQSVYSKKYNTEKTEIDISGLPPGMYIVRINDTEIKKFVKQ